MINSERNIYIQETEVKPNTYALLVQTVCILGVSFCWILAEIGIFRVGKTEIRIGSVIPLLTISVPYIMMLFNRSLMRDPRMKYVIMTACSLLTLSVTTLLTFHTTIMLLFPIFIAMLYRSRPLAIFGLVSSLVCTVVSPILGYVIGSWDIPLFEELILIGTGGVAEIINPTYTVTALNIGKIALYLIIPHLVMVGSCALLMFYVVKLGGQHVENQILLNRVSHRDALTGLYNQNYYKELVSSTLPDGKLGVLFFDVNGLKAANDAYGHEYGDLLLKRSAQSLIDVCTNEKENAFRIGGDEFLLLLEGADGKAVEKKLGEWEVALGKINEENKADYDGLVCSMACGHVVGNIRDIEDLVREADTLMYENKARMKGEIPE